MRQVDAGGISCMEPLQGGGGRWYWGMDYTGGDLYEAEELFRQGRLTVPNRLVLVHYPDGRVVWPAEAGAGQSWGRPIFDRGRIALLLVDFPAETIRILEFDGAAGNTSLLADVPLSAAADCYNLMLKGSPLLLTRQGFDNRFQILWPERVEFPVGDRESFCCAAEEKLYFSAWHEDPDYREELIVRRADTGEIVDRRPGSVMMMPDGQAWLLAQGK